VTGCNCGGGRKGMGDGSDQSHPLFSVAGTNLPDTPHGRLTGRFTQMASPDGEPG
jgi:hypothetical protein